MPVGAFNTAVIPQDLAAKSFEAYITRLMPNGSAPLYGLTAMLKEATAAQIEHGFYSKTMLFPSVTLSAAATNTDTTLTVVSTANILVGMLLRADSTNENMLVTGILSATQLQVQRGLGTISAAAISSSVSLWMVGNAYEEASLRPAPLIIIAQRVTNYTQIFRNTWAVSETARATMLIAGDTAVAESKQDCAAFHAADIEKALFFGQRYFGSRNNQPLHTMDGIINSITQFSPGNITTLGGTTNWTQLEAACDPVFNQNTNPKTANERLYFCGGFHRRVLHNVFRLNSTYFIEKQSNNWGLRFDQFEVPRGSFTLLEHPLFNAYGQSSTWAKMGVIVDLNTFGTAYLTGRKTTSKEFNTQGNIAQDNGTDSVGGTLTSELTCLVKNAPADAVLYNATAGAVG